MLTFGNWHAGAPTPTLTPAHIKLEDTFSSSQMSNKLQVSRPREVIYLGSNHSGVLTYYAVLLCTLAQLGRKLHILKACRSSAQSCLSAKSQDVSTDQATNYCSTLTAGAVAIARISPSCSCPLGDLKRKLAAEAFTRSIGCELIEMPTSSSSRYDLEVCSGVACSTMLTAGSRDSVAVLLDWVYQSTMSPFVHPGLCSTQTPTCLLRSREGYTDDHG